MKTFLSETVKELAGSKESFRDTLCVLPSERAGVFLAQELKQQTTENIFLPEIISIEGFIERVSEFRKEDNVNLLFDFYKVYTRNEETPKETFDSFSQWASVALQDFNEVDRHLVNAADLFTYLRDIKRIEKWSVGNENKDAGMMENHLSFMEKLDVNYQKFYEYLVSQKKGYQGLLYREAAKNIETYAQKNSSSKIVFIGFNALNKAEEYIFQELLKSELATVYWDADTYYMDSSKSAGTFLRKYKENWTYFEKNQFKFIGQYIQKDKEIYEIAATKNVSQIKTVGSLLEKQHSLENTALVLADESLLSLTLNSLPEKVDKLNITMGYALADMPMVGLFHLIFDLYLNQEKFGKKDAFYHKDFERLVSHPFFYRLFGESEDFQRLKKFVIQNNQVFVSVAQIQKNLVEEGAKPFLQIFEISQEVPRFIKVCIALIEANKENFKGFEKECLYRFYNLFLQLENLNSEYQFIKSIKILQGIYQQLITTEKLSFQGEPLTGLQLMGMLETRALDFETVIVASVNEGVLPAGKTENSFIPFDVKIEYGLPTYREKDAIFSSHFYRLIQRAKKVYLLYNTDTDEYGAGEKSRFLTQLEVEGFSIVKSSVSLPVVNTKKEEQLVQKTPEIITALKKIATSGFSPSALSTYVSNPIAYYKRYLLKIKDLEEVEETIAFNTLGTVVHEVLEEFYRPFIGKFVVAENVKSMQKEKEKALQKSFQKHYQNGNLDKGKNKLIFEVAKAYVSNFLAAELRLLVAGKQLKIIGTETKIKVEIQIDGLDFPIYLKGEVDRIDELDGVKRIVDYKSGKVTASELKMPDFSKIKEGRKYNKALQVMFYAFLYTQENKTIFDGELESGIFSFKNSNEGFLKMNFAEGRAKDHKVTSERVIEYMEVVKEIINELFDMQTPFEENTDDPYT
jgi:ATP-dependent helicase/nuclease subunit B